MAIIKKIVFFLILLAGSVWSCFNYIPQKGKLSEDVILINDYSDEIIFENDPVHEIGYIIFPKYNQRNKIMLGVDDSVLNAGHVGMHLLSESLDKTPNNVILAAHNRKGLFNVLEKLKIHDIVKINSLIAEYVFKVERIENVDKNQLMYYDSNKDKRILTLITCVAGNKKRLIITLVEVS